MSALIAGIIPGVMAGYGAARLYNVATDGEDEYGARVAFISVGMIIYVLTGLVAVVLT